MMHWWSGLCYETETNSFIASIAHTVPLSTGSGSGRFRVRTRHHVRLSSQTFRPRRHHPAALPALPLPPPSAGSRPIRAGGGTRTTRSGRWRWSWWPARPEAPPLRPASSGAPSSTPRRTWTPCRCGATGRRTWTR